MRTDLEPVIVYSQILSSIQMKDEFCRASWPLRIHASFYSKPVAIRQYFGPEKCLERNSIQYFENLLGCLSDIYSISIIIFYLAAEWESNI